MDEYTQTQVEGQRILFDVEVQTVEDTWEMKYFKATRENEMIKNDLKTFELEKTNLVLKFEDQIQCLKQSEKNLESINESIKVQLKRQIA